MEKKWLTLFRFILIVLITVSLFTAIGILRPLEMKVYDEFVRFRPQESLDQRIVIVAITDKDIERYGVTIPDILLSRIIEQIRQHNPRVIGIDLHRNQPIGNGYDNLNQVLKSTPGIVGVEKTNQGSFDFPEIKPNIELAKKGMSSASDLIEDQGDVVRRGYLYVSKGDNSQEQLASFGLKVSLEYLKHDHIFPVSSDPKNHYLKLNNVIFPRLRFNNFFYQPNDIDGYQTIINYRNSVPNFQKISLETLFSSNFNPELLENKIVLIGLVAPSLTDDVSTPLNRNVMDYTEERFGVEVHASQASQIISAVKDNRKIIKFFPATIEYLWLMIWIILPAYLVVYQLYSKTSTYNLFIQYVIANLLVLIFILLVGYISILVLGYWIPTATAIFSLLVNFIISFIYIEITKEKQLSKQLQTKLNSKIKQLEDVQRELIAKEKMRAYGDFSVKMAHEIGNILNSIQLANDNSSAKFDEVSQLLEESSFLYEEINRSDASHPFTMIDYINNRFSKINKAITKASQITNIIRSEYKLDSENQTYININQFIRGIVNDSYWLNEPISSGNKIDIQFNLSSNIPEVKIYPLGLESVLVNLLSNANYSVSKKLLNIDDINFLPMIAISTINYSSTIEIKVKDNGEGIPQDNLDQIFCPFWTTKRAANGLGVGLFFCRQNVSKHNGKIEVQSELGKWTEFTICLPKISN